MLLDTGANINTKGGWYSNILQVVLVGSYEKVVQILLDTRANINTKGGNYSNILQVVLVYSYKKVV